ncbi:MAG: TIGR03790 family protein [Burkholderiaceae bacterium]|nr:TIGR03790 family protein [Burkholderiaceae bacterium]
MLLVLAALVACGGGGTAPAESALSAPAATVTTVGEPDGQALLPSAVSPAVDPPPPRLAAAALVGAEAPVGNAAAASLAPARPPELPRTGLAAADLAVLYAVGDPTSEAIARAYQRARGIPEANLFAVAIPTDGDQIGDSDFAPLKADLDARLPAGIQATLVTWTRPSRVAGARCAMGLTSALAFGYDPAMCGGCSRTQASAYFDTDTTRPWTDLRIRPSMMLGAATLEAAQALIERGLAADGSAPTGTGWGVRTSDAARSVRYPDYLNLDAAWSQAPGPAFHYLDASAAGSARELVNQTGLLFYFTGLARPTQAASNHFLPGAVADHLTSFGGYLPTGKGQMPVTEWLAAGATASYGTVEEPCNHPSKFPQASVLIDHYVRGATVIEAYWKSVAMPGQGLFVGEPLARPWASVPGATIEGGELVIRSRGLRRNGNYRVEWQDPGSELWRALADTIGGQPQPVTWRVPLPADTRGGRLRWVGPCPLQPSTSCVLATG